MSNEQPVSPEKFKHQRDIALSWHKYFIDCNEIDVARVVSVVNVVYV